MPASPSPRREGRRTRDRSNDRRDSRRGGDRNDTRPRGDREKYPKAKCERMGSTERDRSRQRYERPRDRERERERGGRDRDRSRERGRDREVGRERDRPREEGRRRDDDDRPLRNRELPRPPKRGPPSRSRSPPRVFDPKRRHETALAPAKFAAQGGDKKNDKDGEKPVDKEKPNFKQTGLLAAASNTLNSVVLKYTEPLDSRLPPANMRYRLYTFKDGTIVGDPLNLSTQPAWLIGRDRLVADIPVDHPSCSKQHAVIQFRYVVKKVGEFGDKDARVRPYVLDLESANGTKMNGEMLPETRFVELKEGDMLMFGHSTREYILMLEKD